MIRSKLIDVCKVGLPAFLLAVGAVGADVKAADVVSGQTNVLLDTDLLSSAASLDLSSVSTDVIAPGNLGAGSVAFGINSRTAASLPTTFSYNGAFAAAGSFSGTIEHAGSVFFNNDTVEVGDFTIGFDGNRAGSGFFVESTTGIPAILFDLGAPSQDDATPSSLTVAADLLVSPEFANFLLANSLASADLTGADVGDALVEANAVPEPTAAILVAVAAAGLAFRRRA